jgi:NADH dehydrogenase FAD-containing subunit
MAKQLLHDFQLSPSRTQERGIGMPKSVPTNPLHDAQLSGNRNDVPTHEPLRSILSHQENIDVLLNEVTGISPKQRIVHLT